ncbi:MAG: hypothetical protein WAO08_03705 [Hyphomicrobiaceae bacterium]
MPASNCCAKKKANDEIPTSARFIFYELEQAGVVPKRYDGKARTPAQDVSVGLMQLRKTGLVPWHWIEDETRSVDEWQYANSVADYILEAVDRARIDCWQGEEPPLTICESRATKGVLGDLAYEYLVPITATSGQSGGFIVTEIVPLQQDHRRVLYVGDFELRGPADQIEANTRRKIEEHTGRRFGTDEWAKIALTEDQVERSARLKRLAIPKLDKRNKPPKRYDAIECEAIGQGALVRLIRKHLDRLLPEPIGTVSKREERQ